MEQILMRILAYTYSLIALPAMAIIGIAYYKKNKTKGSLYFMVGAIATAIGSMFNQLFPKHLFIDKSTGFYSPAIQAISKNGFWFKIATDPSFNPQAPCRKCPWGAY